MTYGQVDTLSVCLLKLYLQGFLVFCLLQRLRVGKIFQSFKRGLVFYFRCGSISSQSILPVRYPQLFFLGAV